MASPKNLKDMAASKEFDGVKKTDLYKIDPRLICEEDGFNIRDYNTPEVQEHIENLAQAMLAGTFIPPITVHADGSGKVVLIDGHCRHKAALKAIERGAEGLMLTAVNFRGSDVERIELMLRSGEGLKFTPIEIAKGYLRLKRMNISTADIAKSVGKSLSHVEQYLTLATSNHDVQQMVERGEVSATVAIQAVRKDGENAGKKLNEAKAASGGKKVTAKAFKPSTASLGNIAKQVGILAEMLDDADFGQFEEGDELSIPYEVWQQIGKILELHHQSQKQQELTNL